MARGLIGLALREAGERLGVTVEPTQRVRLLEASDYERRALERDYELLAYNALDFVSTLGDTETVQNRRQMYGRSRRTWRLDPMAGSITAMRNEFTFGRGVSKPRCKDKLVQEIVDEAWDDFENQEVLTSYDAQLALGTDLDLDSNAWFLMFRGGGDGKVKLSRLNTADVEAIVPDDNNRFHPMWYMVRERQTRWDFTNDRPQMNTAFENGKPKVVYYPHWRNVEAAIEEGRQLENTPPPEKLGKGVVYHVRINRYTESPFGISEYHRTIRWLNAYNDMMKARVDTIKAAAALIMKAKARGTARQLQTMAAKALSRSSWLAGLTDPRTAEAMQPGPMRPGSALYENESLTFEPFKLDTGAGNAQMDQQGIRAQISAGSRFPQHYLGDAGAAGLATATAMELPVLKMIETRQEVIEEVFRWFIDAVIEEAVATGRIPEALEPDETDEGTVQNERLVAALMEAYEHEREHHVERKFAGVRDMAWERDGALVLRPTLVMVDAVGNEFFRLVEAYEDQGDDERTTERDLSYEFAMPDALKRSMTDLVTAATSVAQTLDPNNTNVNLTRFIAELIFAQGFEVQDAADAVERIWPEGYVDPMQAMAMAQAQGGPQASPEPGGFGPDAAGRPIPTAGGGSFAAANGDQATQANPYGAPLRATAPEDVRAQQSVYVGNDRQGRPRYVMLREGKRFDAEPETRQADVLARQAEIDGLLDDDVAPVVRAELERLMLQPGEALAR